MTPAPDYADIASRAAARGIMVTAAGVEEIVGMLAPISIGKLEPTTEPELVRRVEYVAEAVGKERHIRAASLTGHDWRRISEALTQRETCLADVALWKREAADRSEGMIQLNLDRAAMGVAIMQLRKALNAVSAVRPSNWRDDDDPEQAAAWSLLDTALQETARL